MSEPVGGPARSPSFGAAQLEAFAARATELGLERLAAVDLAHPGFAAARRALDAHLDAGLHGEMEFMARTREVRKDPREMLPGAQSVLVALAPHGGEAGPIARYAQFADYHTELHRRWLALVPTIEAMLPGVETLVCVDSKPILERAVAVLGGLGFLGKNGMLIHPGLGSQVMISGLLMSARYEGPDAAPAWARDPDAHAEGAAPWAACGSCTACLDACPTSAFLAPGQLDPRRCISYLTIEHRGEIEPELEAGIGERVAGCDRCQEVCPYNQGRSRESRVGAASWLPKPPGRPRDADLPRLATIGNNQHRGFVKHTPLNRINRRALRRNAVIALGNRVAPLEAAERAALTEALGSEDPLLASAAYRALTRREARESED